MLGLYWFLPAPWKQLSFLIQDSITRYWISALPPDNPIVLVDIDEQSIDLMGAWPWSRALLAHLLTRLAEEYQVSVIGLDVVFPETRQAEEDEVLAQTVARVQPVLAVAFDYQGRAPALQVGVLPLGLKTDLSALDAYPSYGFIANYSSLALSSIVGHISPVNDEQGLIRYIPPLVHYHGQVYPSMAMALLATWHKQILMPEKKGTVLMPWRDASLSLSLTTAGLWTIPYRYKLEDFPVVPAWQILAGQVPTSLLAGKLVIIGSSALGLSDRFATPLAPLTPGMFVHAQMVASGLLNHNQDIAPWLLWGFVLLLLLLLSVSLITQGVGYSVLWLMLGVGGALWWLQGQYQHGAMLPDVGTPILFILFWFIAHAVLEWSLTRQQSERLYRLFRDYLPPHLLAQVVKQANNDLLTPKHQEVTILFADITGFTKMTESMPTQEVVSLTRQVLSILTQAVYEQGGTLDKYMGDALMAFWNAPISQPNHRRLAVAAALSMRDQLQQLNETRQALGLPAIVVRMGMFWLVNWEQNGDMLIP
jgi:adenylate cyclase